MNRKEFFLLTKKRNCMKLLEELVDYCLFDVLTRLPNRQYLEFFIEREMEVSRRLGAPLSVIFIDLDGLKKINDEMGHGEGDKYLKKAAKVIKECIRKADLAVRLGGDEFLVILHTDEKGAELVADRLRRRAEEEGVSFSLGVAEVEGDFWRAVELADQRMYEEKRRRLLG